MKHFSKLFLITMLLAGFVATAKAQNTCATPDVISSVPYSVAGLTTIGTGNDYDDLDACMSASMVNEDYVFSFTPADNMQINIALLNTSIVTSAMLPFANIGLFVTDRCPDDPTSTCVASVDNLQSNPSLANIDLNAGTTYYIIVSSANAIFGTATNVNFDIEITKNMVKDVAVTSIEGLVSSCDLENATIGCYITNNGIVAASGFNVSYTINGGTPETEAYTASIDPGMTEYFEFSTLGNFPTVDEYDVAVYTEMAGDENTLNDLLSINVTRYPVYDVFPYTEDFESNNGYFAGGGTASSWEYGNPDELIADLVINSAASGDYCWVTNLEGAANTNEESYLETPCFDLSSLFLPTLNLNAWVDFSFFGNSANIQASTNGGLTWDVTVYEFAATTTGWENIDVQMPALAGMNNVKFRINFIGGFLVANGIAIDDFSVREAVLNDLGVSGIFAPNTSCGLSDSEEISIEISNFGAQEQTSTEITYSIDGGATWLATPEVFTSTMFPGQQYYYTFTTTADLSAYGNYEILAKVINPGDEDITNDEFNKTVVSQATIAVDNYLESFETGPAGWYAYGENSTMELAMPANTLINSAADGDYAWVTNATGFNDPAEVSYLESPCFDFTDLVNPKIKAMIQYETMQISSNFYLEYSIDGFTWDTVNAGGAATGWYGAGGLSFGTWSGSSAGWISVSTDLPELAGQASVKFRFVFNNGMFSLTDTEGVAIDKINIYDCDIFPNAEFSYTVNGLDVSFINESENADTYSWNFGDNDFFPSTSTEENPAFSYLMDGTYYVVLTVTNECSSSEFGTYIDVVTGLEILNAATLTVYPNPASETIYVSGIKADRFEIININGQIVSNSEVSSDIINVDIKNLTSGSYFIKIYSGDVNAVIPFVKE